MSSSFVAALVLLLNAARAVGIGHACTITVELFGG
jgi:hypothetical protein